MRTDHNTQVPSTERLSAFSRRIFLQGSMASAGAGLFAGCSTVESDDKTKSDIPDWTTANIPPQRGLRVIVTGGNGYPDNGRSGLGYQTALALAKAGADVVIASRNKVRGDEAVRRILSAAPGATVRFETLDLANLGSVKTFSAKMRATNQGFDLLINNAGVMGRPQREVSVDGFERVFATNTLGHFALTSELLPLLKKGKNPRIVWVASLRTSKALPFNDLQLERRYDYAEAYDNSKLANLLLTFELARRSHAANWGITSLAAHPGVARTNLIPDGPGLDSAEGGRFRMLPFLFQPAAQGALPILYAATSLAAVAGDFYGPKGFQELRGLPGVARVPDAAKDQQSATMLWAKLEQLSKVSF